jgi:hypothetical protein
MELAIVVLASSLSVSLTNHNSHTYLQINGFCSTQSLVATSIYLVGSIAQCVQSDLTLREALFDDGTRDSDLTRDVEGVIGPAAADDQFKIKKRDPWIWEAISHLIVHLSRIAQDFHPSGLVLAKTQVKYDINDHGLDLIALYEAAELGVTAGESKAYLDDPGRAIIDAANRLSEVDKSLRDSEIRATVNQLSPAISAAHRRKLGGAFWRRERTYYPFVCCDATAAVDWTQPRRVLNRLDIPPEKKLLVPLSIPNARQVFEALSLNMRQYVAGKLN